MANPMANPMANGHHDGAIPAPPGHANGFTFDEALPYSPHASVIPFIPDYVPEPSIGSGSIARRLAGNYDATKFDALNKEAAHIKGEPPKSVRHAVDAMLHDFKASMKTNYKFRDVKEAPLALPVTKQSEPIAAGLSPVTKAVFDTVGSFWTKKGAFSASPAPPHAPVPSSARKAAAARQGGVASPNVARTPTAPSASRPTTGVLAEVPPAQIQAKGCQSPKPETPLKAPASIGSTFRPMPLPPPQQPLPVTPSPRSIPASQPAPATVVRLPTQPGPAPAPAQTLSISPALSQPLPVTPLPPAPTKPFSQTPRPVTISIELPAAPISREEYVTVDDRIVEFPSNLSSRKRKRVDDAANSQGMLTSNLDHRQRVAATMQELAGLASEISKAMANPSHDSSSLVVLTIDSEPALSSAVHQKLQSLIAKTIDLKSYENVRLGDLLQFLKLSENTLKHASDLNLRIDESWGEEDVASWVHSLGDVEHALKAARTALRIMSGGREDKQLYSEDVIQASAKIIKDTLDGLVVPVVELRTTSPLFKLLTPHKKAITSLMTVCQRVYTLLATLTSSIQLSDMVLAGLSYDACKLTFVDNALTEKESVVGMAKFDGIRLVAMDVICRIFLIRPDERPGIINDILTSLEKLPVGRQSAKQFKITDGGSIQPVSALIMRLIQASSGKIQPRVELGRTAGLDDDDDGGEGHSDEEEPQPKKRKGAKPSFTVKSEDGAAAEHQAALEDLRNCATEPMATAVNNTNYIVHFVTDRALKSTKSGESPYRNLLDQFVEDFTLCLSSPDWPAAELILRHLMVLMTRTFENEKSPAPAKNTALEILGNLCAAVSSNRSHVRKTAGSLGAAQSDELGRFLADLSFSALDGTARPEQVLDWSGPYRATLEYMQGRVADDPHLANAISYLVADWAEQTLAVNDGLVAADERRDQEYGRLAYRLRMMVGDQMWLANEYSFKAVPTTHAKVAYLNILLQSRLFTSFAGILNVLLRSMDSDQATVRSRSLKSINQVIETDPSILDGDSLVVKLALQRSNDSSTQVRDSALGLIGKCIAYRQRLEEKMLPTVLERFLDPGVGVRKRAMKLARDIYLRNKDRTVRSDIANGLLLRVNDPDEGVQELAKQMIEEVWFTPFYTAEKDSAYKIALKEHVALIIHTVKSGNITAILDRIFELILGSGNKSVLTAANGTAATSVAQTHSPSFVCAQFVEAMFDFISNMDGEDPTIPSGKDALSLLHIFAKADPTLFTYEQISILKPYLALSQKPPKEELQVFWSVALVYRRVLPNFSAAMYEDFLLDVRTKLLAAVGKVAKQLLDEVIACIWIISDHLKSLFCLVRVSCSSIGNLKKFHKLPLDRLDRSMQEKLKAYMLIVGFIGKHARLEGEFATFEQAKEVAPLPPKCETVSRMMLHNLLPFTDSSKPRDIRQAALEAMGLVCQSNPRNYVLPLVYTAFQGAFDDRDPGLEDAVMRSFKEFFLAEERRSGTIKKGSKPKGDKRHLLVMGGTNFDDVASATTQRFLEPITRIALASQDEHAFLAIELLGSINRQGLVHPKETGVTLITLETSPHRPIWELAYAEHRGLHEKHESTIEREYAKAMQSAYNYQRDVVKESHGATTNPFQAKLHLWLDVLKISKSRNRQRFLEKMVSQLEFDPAKLDMSGDGMPPQVDYSRFIIENLTYIEYMTVGEVMVTVAAMEKIVTTIGTGVAHTLESDLFNLNIEALTSTGPAPQEGGDQMQVDGATGGLAAAPSITHVANIDLVRLRQWAASAMILHAVWESRTHLRRLYNLGLNKREQKAKAPAKDLAKTPVKVQGIHGDKIWEELGTIMGSLQTEQLMVARCKAFVELMRVDGDFKVADDEDDEMDDEAQGHRSGDDDRPMAIGASGTPEPSGRGRKRRAPNGGSSQARKKARSNSQPPRRRGRPPKNAAAANSGDSDAEEWV